MRRPEEGSVPTLEALGVPHPERVRVLEEIAADVEQMRFELMRRGWSPDDATQEALRVLAPSEAAIAALASVHEPLYASLARRFGSELRWAEWIGLLAVTLVTLVFASAGLGSSELLRRPSPTLVPLLLAAAGVLALVGRKAVQLYVARDHDPARLSDGMVPLLVGSGLAVVLGFGGAVYELLMLAVRLEAEPSRTGELVLPWLTTTSVSIGSGLTIALAGGLAWFLFQQKIAAVQSSDLRAARAVGRATGTVSPRLDSSIPTTGVSR